MIYLDTSAAAKVVLRERESLALRGWLDGQAGPGVSSVITKIELARAAERMFPAFPAASGADAPADVAGAPVPPLAANRK